MYARTQKIRGLTTWIQKALVRKNKNLTAALKESRQESVLKRMADLQLQHDYEKAIATLGRNAADVLPTLQTMQDFGVNLICVEDGIDSSKDAGKLMISVLSTVAEIDHVPASGY